MTFLFYYDIVLYFLRLNRISIKDYFGYSVKPETNSIKIVTRYKTFKISCTKLEELQETLKYDRKML